MDKYDTYDVVTIVLIVGAFLGMSYTKRKVMRRLNEIATQRLLETKI